jgi:hypothetical protein
MTRLVFEATCRLKAIAGITFLTDSNSTRAATILNSDVKSNKRFPSALLTNPIGGLNFTAIARAPGKVYPGRIDANDDWLGASPQLE